MVFFMENSRQRERAQSSLEFLMTYGWGLVVIAVVIAALVLIANPGIIKSGSFSGFKQNMAVVNARYPSSPTDSIQLIVSNVSGRSIKLSALVVKDATGQTINGSATIDDQPIPNQIILAGSQKTITFALNSGGSWPAGSSSLSVEITGTDNDNFSKNSTGTLSFVLPQSAASCGNGIIESGEGCDDGDQQGGDGCDSTCHVESGWQCFGQPSVCYQELSACGNPPGGSWIANRKYVVAADVSINNAICFSVDAAGAVIDCKPDAGATQHMVTRTKLMDNGGPAIELKAGNETVRNCIIASVGNGVMVSAGTDSTIQNNSLTIDNGMVLPPSGKGIDIESGTGHQINSNTISFKQFDAAGSNYAIYIKDLSPSTANTLQNNISCVKNNYALRIEEKDLPQSGLGNKCARDHCSDLYPLSSICVALDIDGIKNDCPVEC